MAASPWPRKSFSWATVMPPTQRRTTEPSAGSSRKNVGSAAAGYALRAFAFFAFSTSMPSQTNRPASLAREGSVKTNALIERQVCHQGAQDSTKIGRLDFLASASARSRSSLMNGTTEWAPGLGFAVAAAEAGAMAGRSSADSTTGRIQIGADRVAFMVESVA